jgi:hypothetical protein
MRLPSRFRWLPPKTARPGSRRAASYAGSSASETSTHAIERAASAGAPRAARERFPVEGLEQRDRHAEGLAVEVAPQRRRLAARIGAPGGGEARERGAREEPRQVAVVPVLVLGQAREHRAVGHRLDELAARREGERDQAQLAVLEHEARLGARGGGARVVQRPVAVDVAADVLDEQADHEHVGAQAPLAAEAQERLVGGVAADAEVQDLQSRPRRLELCGPVVAVVDFGAVGERVAEAGDAQRARVRIARVLARAARAERAEAVLAVGRRAQRLVRPAQLGVERAHATRLVVARSELALEPAALARVRDRAEGRQRTAQERPVLDQEGRDRDVGEREPEERAQDESREPPARALQRAAPAPSAPPR